MKEQPRTLAEAADELTRLNAVGKSTDNRRSDSEWFSGHQLVRASVTTEDRETFAAWLRLLAPSHAHTATSTLTPPDDHGVPVPVLAAWLARMPADAVITRDGEAWVATWTESTR